MKIFAVLYRYRTRPRYRKGRTAEKTAAFVAHDLYEALRLARAEAEKSWPRRKWSIVSCLEIK